MAININDMMSLPVRVSRHWVDSLQREPKIAAPGRRLPRVIDCGLTTLFCLVLAHRRCKCLQMRQHRRPLGTVDKIKMRIARVIGDCAPDIG